MKSKILIFGMALALLTVGCSKNESATDNSAITSADAGVSAKIDAASDDVATIVENQTENPTSTAFVGKNSNEAFSTCATITISPAISSIVDGTTVTKTIDFGTGCNLANGNFVSGIITMSFVYHTQLNLINSVTYTFTNFHHNLIQLDGTKTFTRTVTGTPGTTSFNPIITMNMDMTATFPNGNSYHRTGTRVRTITAGMATVSWTDDVYSITGNWTTTLTNTGVVTTATITSPVVLKMSCVGTSTIFVQGVISYVRGTHNATLDYGDGTCNNLAVFTIDGVVYNITI